MNLLLQLQRQLKEQQWQNKKIIVAVSGGVDSMVLSALLSQMDLVSLHLAHCNFGLRGEEADGDEQMIKEWAEKKNIPLSIRHFDTPKILREEGGNLQDTARKLRYDWFEQLREHLNFDFIAVAHHRQDVIETLLMNFFKGTGIKGLHGILAQQGKVIRPLLNFQKEDLKNFAQKAEIPWREDSSNATNHYLRNKIRHRLWPEIEAVFPQAKQALWENKRRFEEVELLYREKIEDYRKKLLEKRGKDWYIPILKLKKIRPIATVLFELLKPFGFNAAQVQEAIQLMNSESGKWIANEDFRLLKDRHFLIITKMESQNSHFICIEKKEGKQVVKFDNKNLEITYQTNVSPEEVQKFLNEDKGQEVVAIQAVDFPLFLRRRKAGDYFYPIGMGRKKKKVGRFLRDLKVPLHEKEKVWLLESHNRIIWVVGYRIDERFKVRKRPLHLLFMRIKKGSKQTNF